MLSLQLNADDHDLRYQLLLRREYLCRLCATWKSSVQGLDTGNGSLPPWGPSSGELLAVRVSQVTAALDDSVVNSGDVNSDESDSEMEMDNDEEDADIMLLDTLDAVDHAEAFRYISYDDNHLLL